MVPGFEILLDCHNNDPELKKEDTTRVPTDWTDYMDSDAMTMLPHRRRRILGDLPAYIEEPV